MAEKYNAKRLMAIAVAAALGLSVVAASAPADADGYRGNQHNSSNFDLSLGDVTIGGSIFSIFPQQQHHRQVDRHSRAPDRGHVGKRSHHSRNSRFSHHRYRDYRHGGAKYRGHRRGDFRSRFVLRGHGQRGGHSINRSYRFGRN